MNTKVVFIFLVLAAVSQASYNELLFRIAQSKNAGLYVTKNQGVGPETSLSINLDADGGCTGLFIFPALNPAVPEFTPQIGNVQCRWEINGFTEDNDPIAQLFFSEYVLDPQSVFFPNETCSDGCLVFGIETAVIKNGDYIYNEVATFTDLAFNPLVAPALGGDLLIQTNFTLTRFTEEDAIEIIESRGGEVPLVPVTC